jgi:integrase
MVWSVSVFRVLYALLAGSGLRIEEAIALQVHDLRGTVLHVRHSHWNGDLYTGMGVSVPTLMTLRDDRVHGKERTELDNLLDRMTPDQLRLIAQISKLVFEYKSSATAHDPQSRMP